MTVYTSPNIESIDTWRIVGAATRTAAWEQYADAFQAVNALAAQRHLMTRDEFNHVMTDPRVAKHLAWSDDGRLVGQSVITNDLTAWPLISPPFFEQRYPEHYRRKAIWYIGYVCAAPTAPTDVFRRLISDMAPQVFASDGIAVMDFCTYNVRTRHLPRATGLLLKHINPRTRPGIQLDGQEFWAWRFDGEDAQ